MLAEEKFKFLLAKIVLKIRWKLWHNGIFLIDIYKQFFMRQGTLSKALSITLVPKHVRFYICTIK